MSLKKNVIANYFGQGWSALMGLAFVPIYIDHLGIEAYGLVGIYALLQAWLSLLDVGMTPTLGREMARFKGGVHSAQSIRDLLRSIETIAAVIAATIVLGVCVSSGWLASDWLKVDHLPLDVVSQAFNVIGIIIGLRFLENIYRSSIVGLEKQVALNILVIITATLRGFGSVLILMWVSPTIEAFFIWQAAISLLTIISFVWIVYSTIPLTKKKARFSLTALRSIWKFARGMVGITLLSLLLTQVDKVLLSKLLPLTEFGYYSLAAIVASSVFTLISPISQAYFPRFNALIAQKKQKQFIVEYHKSAQLVTVIAGCFSIVLILFSDLILNIWTNDSELSKKASMLVSLLVLGNFLNGLMWIPYQAQLAHGWTGFAIKVNIVSVVILVPAVMTLTPKFGATGAAWIWVILNAGYVFIGIHFMYRKILIAEKWRWYVNDVFKPLGAALFTGLLFKFLAPADMTIINSILWLVMTVVVVLLATILCTSEFSSTWNLLQTELIRFVKRKRSQ